MQQLHSGQGFACPRMHNPSWPIQYSHAPVALPSPPPATLSRAQYDRAVRCPCPTQCGQHNQHSRRNLPALSALCGSLQHKPWTPHVAINTTKAACVSSGNSKLGSSAGLSWLPAQLAHRHVSAIRTVLTARASSASSTPSNEETTSVPEAHLRELLTPDAPEEDALDSKAEVGVVRAFSGLRRSKTAVHSAAASALHIPSWAAAAADQDFEQLKQDYELVRAQTNRSATLVNRRMSVSERVAQQAEHSARSAALEALFSSAAQIDLCFVLDCSGSMTPHIDACATQIKDIAADMGDKLGAQNKKVRYAFIGYRDYEQDPADRFVKLDLTEDLALFRQTVAGVKAIWNSDRAEDVFTALEQAANLSWNKEPDTTRAILHILDDPAHGIMYHGGQVFDLYPSGDKFGRDGATLLSRLRTEANVGHYHFSCIHPSLTKQMIEVFKRQCGDEDWITEDHMASDTSSFTRRAVSVMSSSLSASFARSVRLSGAVKPSDQRPYTVDETPPHLINWKAVPAVKGTLTINIFPSSMADLLMRVAENVPLHEEVLNRNFDLKVASQPFSDDGAVRLPYHARHQTAEGALTNVLYVAKLYRDVRPKANDLPHYRAQMETQAVASFLAEEFCKALDIQGLASIPRLKYLVPATWHAYEMVTARTVNLEKQVNASGIVKYNNNKGFVRSSGQTEENARDTEDVVHAFSHWTHDVTGGKLMVVDLQGAFMPKENQFVLIDPAVHCPDDLTRFTATNLGQKGMDSFFLSHRCNKVCRCLNLKPNKMQQMG